MCFDLQSVNFYSIIYLFPENAINLFENSRQNSERYVFKPRMKNTAKAVVRLAQKYNDKDNPMGFFTY